MNIIEELEKAMQETAATGLELIRKSQMSLDFSAPDPHHVAYTRISRSGAVSQVKAKGQVKEHPAKTAVMAWNIASIAAMDHWSDATTEERNTPIFKKEYKTLLKQRDKTQATVTRHANKMTDKEWGEATEGTDSEREDFATERFHATPTIPKMAAELAKNNLDYNEFETKEGDCDACGKVTDVRTVHDADNGGDTLYGQVCDDCLDEAHRHAYHLRNKP